MVVHSLWKTLWTSENTECPRRFAPQCREKSAHKGWGQQGPFLGRTWG
jgi:hypothetical protein